MQLKRQPHLVASLVTPHKEDDNLKLQAQNTYFRIKIEKKKLGKSSSSFSETLKLLWCG